LLQEDETPQQTAIRRMLGFFGHVMRSDKLGKKNAADMRRGKEE